MATQLTADQQQLLRDLQTQMQQDGTREELKAYLRARLQETPWQKDLVSHCHALIAERGLAQVTVDEMIESTMQRANDTVPQKVKAHMTEHIRHTLIQQAEQQMAASGQQPPQAP